MASALAVNELRLVGVAGTNKVMAGELSRLARRASIAQRVGAPRKEGLGALVYPFDPQVALLAVRYHRTSMRVLWDLFRSPATRLEPLYEGLCTLMAGEARPWFGAGTGISVQAHGVREFAAGGRQIVGTVKNAILDGAAARGQTLHVDAEAPDVRISVRLSEGQIVVSIDLAGRPMHQRGYRLSGGAAPLRENLAAVLVMLARYDGRSEALIDPMAGSGTIAVEAASMAAGRPLWIPPRTPACATLPPFAAASAVAAEPLFADTRPLILANDLAPAMQQLCRRNAERAGVGQAVLCRAGDFRNWSPQGLLETLRSGGMPVDRGLILSNPPYGERIGDPDLLRLYADLGRWCREFQGWRAAFLAIHPGFEAAFGMRARIKKPLSNAALRGYFLLFDL